MFLDTWNSLPLLFKEFVGFGKIVLRFPCAFPIPSPSQNGWVMHLAFVIIVITMASDSFPSFAGNAAVVEMVQFCTLRDPLLIPASQDVDLA